MLMTPIARAVVVRGRVTTPLGAPLEGARVQLIRLTGGTRNVSDAISGPDGEYEIRINAAGRFLLLTSASINVHQFAPQIGYPFYAGRADVLKMDVTLDYTAITPQTTDQQTLRESALRALAARTTQVAADRLLTQALPLAEIGETPGAIVVQQGQVGEPARLYLRGAPVTKTWVDGVSGEDLGGGFDFGTLTTAGLGAVSSSPAVEVTADPNAVSGLDASAGVLALRGPEAASTHPVLTYAGDAGELSTVRNELTLGVAHTRVDALASFARFNTDNDRPAAPAHLITYAANLGYFISGGTSLRLKFRDDTAATPLVVPFAFYGVQPAGKDAAQNVYSSATFDTRTSRGWHNLLSYGLARKRSETFNFSTLTAGVPVTIHGANGYTASGTASFVAMPAREDFVTDRDEYTYQTDYEVRRWLSVAMTAKYEDERGADLVSGGSAVRAERRHFSLAGSLAGEWKSRLSYQASGFIDDSALMGLRGAPRLGLTYAPVRPGAKKFRGTILHLTAGAGVREPTLAEQQGQAGRYDPARSRTIDAGVEQNVLAQNLTLRVNYFHSQFAHDGEVLGVAPLRLSNALAYRTQGLESEVRYQPLPRLLVHGGYSYLAAEVEQSAATAVFNPNLPGVGIGAFTALTGARPFHRPPNSGFFGVQVTGPAVSASLTGAFAGKSDDSTQLFQNSTLLLPNRNLSPGYVALNASFSYAVTHSVTVYTQLSNVLNDRNISPIGYLSTPFVIRTGVRIRLGRE